MTKANPKRKPDSNSDRPIVAIVGLGQMGLVCSAILSAPETRCEAIPGTGGGPDERSASRRVTGTSLEPTSRAPRSRARPGLRATVTDQPSRMFSVVIPAWNAESVVDEQLAALEAQCFDGSWEVLVADKPRKIPGMRAGPAVVSGDASSVWVTARP